MKSVADANTPGLLVEALTSSGHEVFYDLVVSEKENLRRLFCVVENSRVRKTPLP